MDEIPDTDFYSNFFGSSTANMLFAVLFFIGAWVKTRLNNSRCAGNCYCFECESSLKELETKLVHTQSTQHGLLREIVTHIRKKEGESDSLDLAAQRLEALREPQTV